MFSKIDKKILTASVILIVLILILVFLVSKYITGPTAKIQNFTGGAQIETK